MMLVFTNGLEERLKAELLVHNPRSLKDTVEIDTWIENKYEVLAPRPKPNKEPLSIPYKSDSKIVIWTTQKMYNPFLKIQTHY